MRFQIFPIVFIITGIASKGWTLPKLDQNQIKALESGAILESSQKVQGSRVMMGKALAIIDDVPEAIAYVILDVGAYKNYLPRVTESRLVKKAGWHTFGVFHTDLPWPVKDCWVYLKFTRYDKPGRVFELKWWMINGTMKNYFGSAYIEPWDKSGKRSFINYQILAEPQTAAPDSLLSRGVIDVANTFLKRVRLRLKALRKFKKMPRIPSTLLNQFIGSDPVE